MTNIWTDDYQDFAGGANRGASLTDSNIEDAAHSIVNDGFGTASGIISAPIVFNDYVKQFHESKRVMVGNPTDATTGATMGQKVNQTATQFGMIDLMDDIFFDRRLPKAYNAGAETAQSPAAITPDGPAPTAVVTDTNNQFGTAFAGSYFYGPIIGVIIFGLGLLNRILLLSLELRHCVKCVRHFIFFFTVPFLRQWPFFTIAVVMLFSNYILKYGFKIAQGDLGYFDKFHYHITNFTASTLMFYLIYIIYSYIPLLA